MVQKSCTSWCGKYGIIYKVLFIFIYIYICQVSTSISFLLPFREDELEQGNCWNDVLYFRLKMGILKSCSEKTIVYCLWFHILGNYHGRVMGPKHGWLSLHKNVPLNYGISRCLYPRCSMGTFQIYQDGCFFSFMTAFHSSPHPAHMGMLDLTFCQTTLEFLGSPFCWWFRNPAITTWNGAKTL